MRVMMIVKATKESEAGAPADPELLAAMMKYNEELTRAGVLLDLGGLRPSSQSARVRFAGGRRTVIDGPFTEAKEVIGGFWMIQVKSLAEAIEWAKRCPNPHDDEGEIELRPLFELSDFPQADDETLAIAAEIGEQIGR